MLSDNDLTNRINDKTNFDSLLHFSNIKIWNYAISLYNFLSLIVVLAVILRFSFCIMYTLTIKSHSVAFWMSQNEFARLKTLHCLKLSTSMILKEEACEGF